MVIMKIKIKKIILLISSLGFINSAYAYKFVIFTDETTSNTSEGVADALKTTYPFSSLNIEVEIVRVKHDELNCNKQVQDIEVSIICDNSLQFQKSAKEMGGDQALIVKSSDVFKGSGGQVPIITSDADPRTMIHEYLHTIGLSDEYQYSASEAQIYCKDKKSAPNTAYIKPQEPYAGDAAARSIHGKDIPWFGDIKPETKITTSNGTILGTGVIPDKKGSQVNQTPDPLILKEPTGLYRGIVCDLMVPPMPTWHPGGATTIMRFVQDGLGAPLEKIVKEIMIKRGATEKMQVNIPTTAPEPVSGSHVASPTTAEVQPEPVVDNSSRNLFKDFFSLIQDLIKQNENGVTR
jgi:hypothetical protein